MTVMFMATPTDGLLDVAVHEISLTAGIDAKAHSTTQCAAKIYAMPDDGGATQRLALSVAVDGYLEYPPDPLTPYLAASLNQSVAINLGPGVALLSWKVITPGRTAMNESSCYRRRLTVNRGGGSHPAYREAHNLKPADGGLMGLRLLSREASQHHPPAPKPHPARKGNPRPPRPLAEKCRVQC